MSESAALKKTVVNSPINHRLTPAAVLLAVSLIAGCASSSGVIKQVSPALINKPVSLDTVLVHTTSSLAGLKKEKTQLNDLIFSGLKGTGLFTTVTENGTTAGSGDGIRIESDIRAIKPVSDNSRQWFGALAGQAKILVKVTIFDLKSGNQIESFEVEGKSGQSAYAGTTDEAIQKAAEQVVAAIVRLNAQTGQ